MMALKMLFLSMLLMKSAAKDNILTRSIAVTMMGWNAMPSMAAQAKEVLPSSKIIQSPIDRLTILLAVLSNLRKLF